ncbi:MAG: hypothetical protein JJT78_07385, partial [Leptospira sp.]|nr:hypothetical protein [Leptospira sp.]
TTFSTINYLTETSFHLNPGTRGGKSSLSPEVLFEKTSRVEKDVWNLDVCGILVIIGIYPC